MKSPLRFLLLGAACCVAGLLPLHAQQPAAPVQAPPPAQPAPSGNPVPRQRQTLPTQTSAAVQRAALIPLLSRNYLVRITVTEGDKVTEYKLVTASSAISISSPPGAEAARSVSINGQLEESEENLISVALVMSLAIPEPPPAQPQAGGPPQFGRSSQGQSESFSASLRAKPGVDYPLFTTAARTYRLTITPHEEQAAASPK